MSKRKRIEALEAYVERMENRIADLETFIRAKPEEQAMMRHRWGLIDACVRDLQDTHERTMLMGSMGLDPTTFQGITRDQAPF